MRIAFLLGCCFFLFGSYEKEALIIDQTEIIVKGKTTIGSFECSYEHQGKRDTLLFDNKSTGISSLDFEIPITAFGCGNFLLNSDFKKTLKAEEYPMCLVSVNNLQRGSQTIVGDIYLQMAGKELFLESETFYKLKDRLQGTLHLSTEELGLDATSRLGGLIKVEETIDLEINLYLEGS